MTKSDDYLWDRGGEDADVARLEELMAPLRHDAPLDELRLRRKKSRWPIVMGGMVAIAAVLALVMLWPKQGSDGQVACVGFGMSFSATGDVTCNGSPLAAGVLPINGTIDTGKHEAELAIADIGTAKLGTDTVVKLQRTEAGKRHQLFLQEGKMHAKVNAPPKIFAVTTASTNIEDLGCEYRLEIDKQGAGKVVVLTGKVELESGTGKPIIAREGTHVRLLPGRRASLPVDNRASPEFDAAMAELDDHKPDAVAHLMAAAKLTDLITFTYLIDAIPADARRPVLQRLAELSPAPQCVTVDDALADADFLSMWIDEVYLVWLGKSEVGKPCK